jgi:hypothetical protein
MAVRAKMFQSKGHKRAVAVLAILFVIGNVLQFFNKKKPLAEGN